MKNKKGIRGVITVLVSLMLVGVLSVGTLVIEAGRYQAAKTQLSDASISAATSMIAAYDADLYERYGLLAIDTERFTEERAEDYLMFNADQAFGYKGNRVSRLYTVDSMELTGLYNLTYPSILKRQILVRAKYHVVPQNYALNVDTMTGFFADFQKKCEYVSEQLTSVANGGASNGSVSDIPSDMQAALKVLYETYSDLKTYNKDFNITLSGSTIALLPSTTGIVENGAPSEDVDNIDATLANASTVLGGAGSTLSYTNGTATEEIDVGVSTKFVSDIKNKLKDVSSATNTVNDAVVLAGKIKELAQGFKAALNMLSSDKDGNLLLNSYISQYFSNVTAKVKTYSGPSKGAVAGENATFISACVEYVFGGNASETENQSAAYNYIQAIRLINNLYSVMTNSQSFKASNVYSVAAHIAWANFESIVDMELLTKYNTPVPFNKNKMILSVGAASSVASAFSSHSTADALKTLGYYNGTAFVISGSNSFSYKDSLAFALWFVPNSDKMLCIADLVQLEMRYREQYIEGKAASFLMSEQNTYCRIKCTAKFSALLPTISLGSGNSVKGVEFQSIKYAGY